MHARAPRQPAYLVVLLQALAGEAAVGQGQGEVQVAAQLVVRLGLWPRQQLTAQAQRQAGQADLVLQVIQGYLFLQRDLVDLVDLVVPVDEKINYY